jgi:thioredoxin 1
MTAKLTQTTFPLEVLESGTPVLIDFYADWCMPCKMLSPVIDEIARQAENFKVFKVNVDEEPELAGRFQVMSIPTLVAIKNGQVVNRLSGVRPKEEILAMLGK